MDMLNAWLREIVMLAVFASFAELLLPQSTFQKYIRVIMGLLILVTLLKPIIAILHGEAELAVPSFFQEIYGEKRR